MREIKFKYIFQHEETGRILALIFTLDEIQAEGFEDRLPARYRLVDRLQLTGRKDRNGRDIYDGDVFRDYDGILYYVSWDNYFSKWSTLGTSKLGYKLAKSTPGDFQSGEVIGNIYENPELLNQK